MLKKLKDIFFWEQQYDAQYRTMSGRHHTCLNQIENEKRLYWSTVGKQRAMTPEVAAHAAVEGGISSTIKENEKTGIHHDQIVEMVMRYVSFIPPGHPEYENRFTGVLWWRKEFHPFFVEGKRRADEKEKRILDVRQHSLSVNEAQQGAQVLLSGDIDEAVIEIFRNIEIGRTAQEVCTRTGLDLEEVVYWLNVLAYMNIISRRVRLGVETSFWRGGGHISESSKGEPYETFRSILAEEKL